MERTDITVGVMRKSGASQPASLVHPFNNRCVTRSSHTSGCETKDFRHSADQDVVRVEKVKASVEYRLPASSQSTLTRYFRLLDAPRVPNPVFAVKFTAKTNPGKKHNQTCLGRIGCALTTK